MPSFAEIAAGEAAFAAGRDGREQEARAEFMRDSDLRARILAKMQVGVAKIMETYRETAGVAWEWFLSADFDVKKAFEDHVKSHALMDEERAEEIYEADARMEREMAGRWAAEGIIVAPAVFPTLTTIPPTITVTPPSPTIDAQAALLVDAFAAVEDDEEEDEEGSAAEETAPTVVAPVVVVAAAPVVSTLMVPARKNSAPKVSAPKVTVTPAPKVTGLPAPVVTTLSAPVVTVAPASVVTDPVPMITAPVAPIPDVAAAEEPKRGRKRKMVEELKSELVLDEAPRAGKRARKATFKLEASVPPTAASVAAGPATKKARAGPYVPEEEAWIVGWLQSQKAGSKTPKFKPDWSQLTIDYNLQFAGTTLAGVVGLRPERTKDSIYSNAHRIPAACAVLGAAVRGRSGNGGCYGKGEKKGEGVKGAKVEKKPAAKKSKAAEVVMAAIRGEKPGGKGGKGGKK
ncbi:hypothetical protein MMC18_004161 [Xylographa bjoerkii]|nr:hypothetical protein [Xylographa bjoerkii]